jgi:hypothetical protein
MSAMHATERMAAAPKRRVAESERFIVVMAYPENG